MEHKMLWGTLALGAAGWACLLVLAMYGGSAVTPSSRKSGVNPFDWLALALPFLVWLATLPTKAPFSAGQGWGRGFLMGGIVAFISIFVVLRISKTPENGKRLVLTSMFAALAVVCVPLLWMRHAVIEASLGIALGWCVVSLVWLCSFRFQKDSFSSPSPTLGLLNGATFVATLCSVAALGVYRDFSVPDVARGTYSAVALTLATSVALALLFAMLLDDAQVANLAVPKRLSQVIVTALSLLVPLGLGFLLATRVLDDIKVVYCLAIGGVLGLLSWLLPWNSRQQEERSDQYTIIPPVAVLVTLSAFMLSYSFLQGFGVGLMLLAAWPASQLLWPSPSAQTGAEPRRFDVVQVVSLLAAFLAVLLVSRVFATRFRSDLRGISLVDQFALFGFLSGALIPSWLASLWFNGKQSSFQGIASLLQIIGIGLLTLLLPSAMLAIWGIKVVPAFFAGLALTLAGWGIKENYFPRLCALTLFALSLSLVVTQWTTRFLPLAEASRAQRMHFLLWGLGSAAVLVVLVDLSARLIIWLQGRRQIGGGVPTQGVSS